MEQYLSHYGILGQKWGIRRFQNPDGSLTAEGKKRYSGSKLYGDTEGIRKLIDTLSNEQRDYIGDGYWIDKNRTVYRNTIKNGDSVDAFLDVYNLPTEHTGEGTVVLAVSNSKSGMGYATKLGKNSFLITSPESSEMNSKISYGESILGTTLPSELLRNLALSMMVRRKMAESV